MVGALMCGSEIQVDHYNSASISRWVSLSEMGPQGKNKQVGYIVSDGPSG
jgi:hypothetical protein